MRNSVSRNLALLIAAICLGGLAVQYFFTQQSFRDGLSGYVEQQLRLQLDVVAVRAADYYTSEGSWQQLANRSPQWRQIMTGRSGFSPRERRRERLAGDRSSRPRHREGRLRGRADERSGRPLEQQIETELNDHRDGATGPDSLLPDSVLTRMVLTDVDGHFVAGARPTLRAPKVLQVAVTVAGEQVGQLAVTVETELAREIDRHFAQQLGQRTWLIAATISLLALIIAWLAARRFVRPVQDLDRVTDRLMQGDYEAKAQWHSGDEFGALAEKFNRLAVTLNRNRTEQRHWISNISHELRTPVAILKAELQTLESGLMTAGPEEIASLLEEVARLGALIDDLFLLSQSDAGELHYQFDVTTLNTLLTETADEMQVRIDEAGLLLDWQLPDNELTVRGDARRLQQLLTNLLENSCRYTDRGGKLRLGLKSDKDGICFWLEDSAPGIAEHRKEKIFQRLYRVDHSRSRASGGAGLGLSICQAIAEAHGATITAEDSSLGGLRVKVCFPPN